MEDIKFKCFIKILKTLINKGLDLNKIKFQFGFPIFNCVVFYINIHNNTFNNELY